MSGSMASMPSASAVVRALKKILQKRKYLEVSVAKRKQNHDALVGFASGEK